MDGWMDGRTDQRMERQAGRNIERETIFATFFTNEVLRNSSQYFG
jgi:hypothetical protein